jgi:hypothetical protein
MILMDGLIVDRVAVSVAVNSSIMQTRVGDHRTAAAWQPLLPRCARSSYRTSAAMQVGTRRDLGLPKGQDCRVVSKSGPEGKRSGQGRGLNTGSIRAHAGDHRPGL